MSVKDNDMVNQYTAQKAEEIKSLIGATTDTGGSVTAGTVMGKENATLEILNKIYNGLCGDAGIMHAFGSRRYTIFHGTDNEGNSYESPVTFEGKGYVRVSNASGSNTSVKKGLCIDGVWISKDVPNFSSSSCDILIPFFDSVSIYNNSTSSYVGKYLILIESDTIKEG